MTRNRANDMHTETVAAFHNDVLWSICWMTGTETEEDEMRR